MIEALDILADLVFDDWVQLEVALRFAWPRVRRSALWSLRVLVGWSTADGLTELGAAARLDRLDVELLAQLEAM